MGDTMIFKLTEKDFQKIDKWYDEVVKPHLLEQRKQLRLIDPEIPDETTPIYYGAIGGALTYSFTPTGLGMVVKITENLSQLTLDITEYDEW